jgi:uncharacterized protein (DUF2336 family)
MAMSTASNTASALVESRSLLDELVSPVAGATAKHRHKIIDRVTDLFAAGSRSYSDEQISLFDDVLRRLAADIEIKARAKLAHRLAVIDNAPPVLIRSLAFDDAIEVAEPVLIYSERLTDDDLVENATTKSQDHLYAIAQRLKLSEKVTDVLVERGDQRVVHKVVKNKGARFSLAGFGKLTGRARYDRKLTLALGERSDLPRQYFLKLLEAASSKVRAKLEASNPQLVMAIRDTVDDVATAMQREVRKGSRAHAGCRSRSQAPVQCPAHHRGQRSWPRPRAGFRKNRGCARAPGRFPGRSGGARFARRGRGYAAVAGEGGRLFVDNGARNARYVRRQPESSAR